MLKILHTADIHLGSKFAFLKEKAPEYRQILISSLESLYEVATKNKVNVVIIAGDLFDNPYPSATTVEIVTNFVDRLTREGIYVVMIPGNHDYLAQGGVYQNGDLVGDNSKLIIFNDPNNTKFKIDELNLVVHAKPNNSATSKNSPLPFLDKSEGNADPLPSKAGTTDTKVDGYIHVAVAHGSVDVKGKPADNRPISSEEIEKSGFHYIALGDWHGSLDVSAGKVKAFYPGSLEPLAIDQKKSGNVLLVEIAPDATQVKTIKTGQIKIVEIEIDIEKAGADFIKKIEANIQEFDMAKLLVDLKFVGIRSLKTKIEVDELRSYFSSKVFFMKIEDKSNLELDEEELRKYPDYTILGKFIKYIQEKKDVDDKLKQKAIQKGVQLLN